MPNNDKYVATAIQDNLINVEAIKGYALPAIKTSILTGALANNYNSDEYINSQEARIDYQNQISSQLGTPLFDTIELSYTNHNYTGLNKDKLGTDITDIWARFDVVKFDVMQSRNIVVTPINGLDGTIKEFISDGDYIINCQATIVFDGIDYYDYAYMQDIQTMFLVQDDIQVASTILNKVFGIYDVVVADYKFSQPEVGMRNIQMIEFTLISDNKADYQIIFNNA